MFLTESSIIRKEIKKGEPGCAAQWKKAITKVHKKTTLPDSMEQDLAEIRRKSNSKRSLRKKKDKKSSDSLARAEKLTTLSADAQYSHLCAEHQNIQDAMKAKEVERKKALKDVERVEMESKFAHCGMMAVDPKTMKKKVRKAQKALKAVTQEQTDLKTRHNEIGKQIQETVMASGGELLQGGGCIIYRHGVEQDYKIEGQIGKGGQATIGKGFRKPIPGKEVSSVPFAIKRFTVVGEEASDKLLEEKAIAKLNHPNIVELRAVYAAPGSTERTLILDFIQGETLINFIDNHGPPKEEMAKEIFRQMVEGMCHMHGKGILHRDFNGANIIISNEEHKVTIIDFGLCEMFPVPGVPFYIENVSGGGMPGFRPPEMQSSPPEPHSYSLDIWALGANLWLLVTGERTFTSGREPPATPEDKSEWDMVSRIEARDLSDDLKLLLVQLLDVDKSNRPDIENVKNCKWLGGEGIKKSSKELSKLSGTDDHHGSHVLLMNLTTDSGGGMGPVTSTVYEYATWSYMLSDWMDGDDYGIMWKSPEGEQVGSDEDQNYTDPTVEVEDGYRWEGHWIVGEYEYGDSHSRKADWVSEKEAGWRETTRRRIWLRVQVPEINHMSDRRTTV